MELWLAARTDPDLKRQFADLERDVAKRHLLQLWSAESFTHEPVCL